MRGLEQILLTQPVKRGDKVFIIILIYFLLLIIFLPLLLPKGPVNMR